MCSGIVGKQIALHEEKIERELLGKLFFLKNLKNGKKKKCTHIHALSNTSPKGHWDMVQSKHCKQTYSGNSRVFSLLKFGFLINSPHLSNLVICFILDKRNWAGWAEKTLAVHLLRGNY